MYLQILHERSGPILLFHRPARRPLLLPEIPGENEPALTNMFRRCTGWSIRLRAAVYGYNTETSPGPAIPTLESVKKIYSQRASVADG